MNQPLISVIIPVYNTGEHLFNCLDSILNQTYSNLQVIIVDDGSTDGSPAICDKYAEKDSRITVIHKQNEGVSKARNTGIEIATGDYYYFPDSDDYIESDTFEYLLGVIKENKCDMVNYEYFVTYPSNEKTHSINETKYGLFGKEEAHKILITDQAFAWNKFFTKKAVAGVRFRDDILRGEDSLFAHMAIENCENVFFDKRPLYHYVQSAESACRGKFRVSQLTALKLYDAYHDLYNEKYPDLWNMFLYRFENLLIMLYFDMYIDESNLSKEMKTVLSVIKKVRKNINYSQVPRRSRIKATLFALSPKLYCGIHKRAVK